MTVLHELLEWSQNRPSWQRDALRRLVLNGELSEDDISALAELCKATHGLAEQQEAMPLARCVLPVPVPPMNTALRCCCRNAPVANSCTSASLTGDSVKVKSFNSLATGRRAMPI